MYISEWIEPDENFFYVFYFNYLFTTLNFCASTSSPHWNSKREVNLESLKEILPNGLDNPDVFVTVVIPDFPDCLIEI